MGLLPNEIMVEILVRLPVKSVFRFKCVSKAWRNMISDDLFRHCYKSRRIAASGFFHHELPSVGRYKRPTIFINTSKVDKEELKSLDFLDKLGHVAASSKGLILVNHDGASYRVCDLVTKKYVTLPKDEEASPLPVAIGFICHEYQHANTCLRFRFKVVRIPIPLPSIFSGSKTYEIETFSSETGKWEKSITKAASNSFFPPAGAAKVIGGVFYWEDYYYNPSSSHLLAYNPDDVQGRIKLIEFPSKDPHESYNFCDFSETQQGQLQCYRTGRGRGGYIEVFILKSNNFSLDDVVQSSQWSLVHKISFSTLSCPIAINPLNPHELFFRMKEEEIFRGGEILSYDRVSQKIKTVCDYDFIATGHIRRVFYEHPIWPCLC